MIIWYFLIDLVGSIASKYISCYGNFVNIYSDQSFDIFILYLFVNPFDFRNVIMDESNCSPILWPEMFRKRSDIKFERNHIKFPLVRNELCGER